MTCTTRSVLFARTRKGESALAVIEHLEFDDLLTGRAPGADAIGGSETALVAQARGGNATAFATLYDRYQTQLQRYCRSRLTSKDDADDAAQEAFLRAWRSIGSFSGDCPFYGWLKTIASNVCTDVIRRRGRTVVVDEFDSVAPVAVDGNAELELVAQVDAALVSEAMDRLTDRHREILRMREFTGWTYEHIADHENLDLPAVKSLIWRARQSLRREFLLLTEAASGVLVFAMGILHWVNRRIVAARQTGIRFAADTAGQLGTTAGAAATAVVVAAAVSAPAPKPPPPALPAPAPAVAVVTTSAHRLPTAVRRAPRVAPRVIVAPPAALPQDPGGAVGMASVTPDEASVTTAASTSTDSTSSPAIASGSGSGQPTTQSSDPAPAPPAGTTTSVPAAASTSGSAKASSSPATTKGGETPKASGKSTVDTPKANGKAAVDTPKATAKADDPQATNGKSTVDAPKANGKSDDAAKGNSQADDTPRANGKSGDDMPKANGKTDDTPKANGKADDTPKVALGQAIVETRAVTQSVSVSGSDTGTAAVVVDPSVSNSTPNGNGNGNGGGNGNGAEKKSGGSEGKGKNK